MSNQLMKKCASRRDWLSRSAALVGVGVISPVRAAAQKTAQTVNDISVMNFALQVENLENAFFQQGMAMFTPADFQKTAAIQAIGGTKLAANVFAYLSEIAQNEQDHVNKLIQTIYSLDGTPQAPVCYNFGITTAESFLELAPAIESIAVAAYDGVIIPQFETSNSTINNLAVQVMVATMATVEARHASFFNLLNLAIPFAAASDTPQTSAQVLAAIAPYLTTTACDPPPVPLTLAVAGPAKDSTITTNQNTVQLDASLSTSATGSPLTYLWQQALGDPPMQILNDTSVIATAVLQGGAGLYTINLKVSDSAGGSDQDTLKINYQP